MKKFYTLALLVPMAFCVNGRQLSPEQALSRIQPVGERSVKSIGNSLSAKPVMALKAPGNDSFTSLYVFENGGHGYVVVSADDCAVPLLGYSDSESFDEKQMSPQLRWWLDFYAAEIEQASRGAMQASTYSTGSVRPDRAAIEPLVATRWDQSAPYNDDCPMYEGSRSVTGCVATAMAQTMKYHNWPKTGKGENSYSWNNSTLSLDFSTITFDWDNMADTYSSSSTAAQNKAVAELMYACGVSVNMDYTSSESGAASVYIAPALYNYFGYSPAMVQPQRAFYGEMDWENIVYDQLAQGMPVLYGGQSNEGGHQFVCDGYSSDGYFHFNWGWSGTSDGYYLLSALDPLTQGIGGSTTGFNYDQSIVINVQPAEKSTVTATPLFYCYGNFESQSSSATLGQKVEFISSQAFYNFGCKTEEGTFGLKIVASDGTVTYAEGSSVSVEALSGIEGFYVTIPRTLSVGTYTVSPAFKAAGSDSWSDILAPLSGTRSLTMTVAQNRATFSKGVSPELNVTDFTLGSEIYLGTNFKASFTIGNTGTNEYYGQLMMGLLDSNGNLVDETSSAVAVDVMPGSSSPVSFIGTFPAQVENQNGQTEDVSAGQYTLVVFDYLTEAVVYEYPSQVNVGEAPSNTSLQVAYFGLVNGSDTVTDAANVKFTGTVTCTNGYYANQLKVAIFPEGATSTSIEGSTDFIFISEGQSDTFSTTIDLTGNAPGEYIAVVYDADNNQLSEPVYFEISEEAGIEDAALGGDGEVKYYNMQGVEMPADSLAPGFYICRQGSSTSKVFIR